MKYAVIDFETTGSGHQDEIIQIGCTLIEHDRITDQYSSFVKPVQDIPEMITQLTGITNEMVQEAPVLDEALRELLPYLEGAVFVAHHAAFDLGFLQRALDECGYAAFQGPVLDTVDILRVLFPELPSLQLSMVSGAFEIDHERPHQADSDAEATAEALLRCIDKMESLPYLTLQRLSHIFDAPRASLHDMKWWIDEWIVQREVQGRLEEPVHAYRQWALAVDDWKDAAELEERELPEDFEAFYTELVEALKLKFDRYEEREAQVTMIHEVIDAFEKQKHLIVEAGTGTGKSLGYLIPSLYYSIKHEQKITISTHTINLQEQIRQRDVPLLNDIMPVPFEAAVLKGRSHYLCLRKFEHKMNSKDYDAQKEQILWAAQMAIWLGETQTGDEEEIHLGPKGMESWRTVSSDADSCLNRACPWFRKCFYHRARNQANQADVVITNHSLLFTDQKADHRLLPAYQRLIIDEAHQFEETAGRHLGTETHYFTLTNALLWLHKEGNIGKLPQLSEMLMHSGYEKAEKWVDALDQAIHKSIQLQQSWDEFFEKVYGEDMVPLEATAMQEGGQAVVRYKPGELPAYWPSLKEIEENIHVHSSELLKTLQKALDEVKDEVDDYDIQSVLTDIQGSVKDIERCRDEMRLFLSMKKDHVYWIEANVSFRHKSLQFFTVPIDVSYLLKEKFFDVKESIVLTSATLSVNRNFAYIREQVGLGSEASSEDVHTVQLSSPFNYRENVLVCIPRDFPKLKGRIGEKEYVEELIRSLAEVAKITQGRMLVLFTSYRMLRDVHGALKEQLQDTSIQVLGQGVDSNNRSKLTKWFTDRAQSVLLGTSSFWEGVDIPGEALSCLVIVRLPFQPPNHPVAEAKAEYLKQKNKNPFMDYTVPQAVIRFKQGFGRLIRTSSDRGIVLIYDTRVIDTYYGKHFLYSLPGPKMEHMSKQLMIERVREWFEPSQAYPLEAQKKG
ncbi:ATP-dependent DNA helicase DinG [Marinicrinis sediminis]|uniref:3'-5' exonuclease DinG n=1 Tax=Marinicrinis sediminis TaxID=1652465 RepID=A0ABW5RDW2_9BACL